MAGLAVTGTGGDVLFIEATAMATGDNHGEAGLTRTDHTGHLERSRPTSPVRPFLRTRMHFGLVAKRKQSTVFTLDAP